MKPLRPNAYAAPDIEAWIKTHGFTPYVLPEIRPLAGQSSIADDARTLIQRDLSTIDAAEATDIHDRLAHFCEAVLQYCDASDPASALRQRGEASAICYFNRNDGRFWAYPFATVPGTKAPILYIDEWFKGEQAKHNPPTT